MSRVDADEGLTIPGGCLPLVSDDRLRLILETLGVVGGKEWSAACIFSWGSPRGGWWGVAYDDDGARVVPPFDVRCPSDAEVKRTRALS